MLVNWEDVLAHAATAPEYPDSLRSALREAVPGLRRWVGELRGAGATGGARRLRRLLANEAPWTRWRLVWLDQVLRRASRCDGFRSVLQRLRDPRSFAESLEVLQVAEPCIDAGLAVGFDPRLRIGESDRAPDLVVMSGGDADRLYIEVTHLFSSAALRASTQASLYWGHLVFAVATDAMPILAWCGRWYSQAPGAEQATWSQMLDACSRDARSRQGLAAVLIPGVVDIAFATSSDDAQLAAWATKRGLTVGHLTGPAVAMSEDWRLARTISGKIAQLPFDQPSLIVIHNHNVGLGREAEGFLTFDRRRLHAHLRRYPSLLGVVLCAQELGWSEPTLQGIHRPPWNSVACRRPFPGRTLHYEFVWNDAFALRKPRATCRALYRSQLRHHHASSA